MGTSPSALLSSPFDLKGKLGFGKSAPDPEPELGSLFDRSPEGTRFHDEREVARRAEGKFLAEAFRLPEKFKEHGTPLAD